MKPFTFFVKAVERPTIDTAEEIAMLKFRLQSIEHLENLITEKTLQFAFKNQDNNITYFQLEATDPGQLDRLMKRDPLWSFSTFTITPVIKTFDLISELQDYLQEYLFDENALKSFDESDKTYQVDEDAEYTLVEKEPKGTIHGINNIAFSPLLSEEQQKAINRRTLYSQKNHNDSLEFNDVNPLGMPIGWNIFKSNEEYAKSVIGKAPIDPYTIKKYTKLNTLKQAKQLTQERLNSIDFDYDI